MTKSLLLSSTCTTCGQSFDWSPGQYRAMGFTARPQRCPACAARHRGRQHDATLERRELFRAVVRIVSLPQGEWRRFAASNSGYAPWRLTLKGQALGADWAGRLDIFAFLSEPPKAGDLVVLTEMEVVKRVRKAPWSRTTLEHGEVSGERQVSLDQTESEVWQDDLQTSLDAAAHEAEEVRTYVRIEPVGEGDQVEGGLVWCEGKEYTVPRTGASYRRDVSLGHAKWSKVVKGSERSGQTTKWGTLAVV